MPPSTLELAPPPSVRLAPRSPEAPRPAAIAGTSDPARLRRIVDEHFAFLWRSLRRLGVSSGDLDDGAQQVFLVVSRKLDSITPGCERSFLFGTAMRVASDMRRTRTRRREVLDDDGASERRDSAPGPDELADRTRARALLDEVLEAMPMDLRAVFVLFELEELPTPEIAAMLELSTGTVASRLRRAREEFHRIVARVRARQTFDGGLR